jgi:N-acetyl-1-D-myo-inositol-2-amino-2-deoxy-alpha-D-glucopyranoside deacetylase
VAKVYWTAFPKGVIRAGIEALRESGQTTGFAAMDPEDLPFGCEDALVTTAIEGAAHYEAKLAAMRAHATQIALDSGFFALSNNIGSPAWSTEFFRLVRGSAGGPLDGDGREADLFGGL